MEQWQGLKEGVHAKHQERGSAGAKCPNINFCHDIVTVITKLVALTDAYRLSNSPQLSLSPLVLCLSRLSLFNLYRQLELFRKPLAIPMVQEDDRSCLPAEAFYNACDLLKSISITTGHLQCPKQTHLTLLIWCVDVCSLIKYALKCSPHKFYALGHSGYSAHN